MQGKAERRKRKKGYRYSADQMEEGRRTSMVQRVRTRRDSALLISIERVNLVAGWTRLRQVMEEGGEVELGGENLPVDHRTAKLIRRCHHVMMLGAVGDG